MRCVVKRNPEDAACEISLIEDCNGTVTVFAERNGVAQCILRINEDGVMLVRLTQSVGIATDSGKVRILI